MNFACQGTCYGWWTITSRTERCSKECGKEIDKWLSRPGRPRVQSLDRSLERTYVTLLRLKIPEESCFVGYAKDAAVLVAARAIVQAQNKLNRVIRLISIWIVSHGLKLGFQQHGSRGLD